MFNSWKWFYSGCMGLLMSLRADIVTCHDEEKNLYLQVMFFISGFIVQWSVLPSVRNQHTWTVLSAAERHHRMEQISKSQSSQPSAFMNQLMKLSNKSQVGHACMPIKHQLIPDTRQSQLNVPREDINIVPVWWKLELTKKNYKRHYIYMQNQINWVINNTKNTIFLGYCAVFLCRS